MSLTTNSKGLEGGDHYVLRKSPPQHLRHQPQELLLLFPLLSNPPKGILLHLNYILHPVSPYLHYFSEH